jgi:hypothetical protein
MSSDWPTRNSRRRRYPLNGQLSEFQLEEESIPTTSGYQRLKFISLKLASLFQQYVSGYETKHDARFKICEPTLSPHNCMLAKQFGLLQNPKRMLNLTLLS